MHAEVTGREQMVVYCNSALKNTSQTFEVVYFIMLGSFQNNISEILEGLRAVISQALLPTKLLNKRVEVGNHL